MNDFDMTRRLARLHLDLANKLFQLRTERGQEIAEVAATTGIPAERIEMIEEGDTTSLDEIARLCSAYQVSLEIAAELEPAVGTASRLHAKSLRIAL